jgi:hypothetical protein
MKNRIYIVPFLAAACLCYLLFPSRVFATQGHGGLEGVYVHQLAHLFFITSMGGLIFWLRLLKLTRQRGWKLIQLSALFFLLWNLDAFVVHLLDDQLKLIHVQRIGNWAIRIDDLYGSNLLRIIYYFARLDHLLCVPASLFLYLGLKCLIKDQESDLAERGRP